LCIAFETRGEVVCVRASVVAPFHQNACAGRAESLAKDSLPFATGFRSREARQPWGVWGGLLERFYWLNRETDEHLKGAVENVKDVIAGQATILALCPLSGGYDDAEITS